MKALFKTIETHAVVKWVSFIEFAVKKLLIYHYYLLYNE